MANYTDEKNKHNHILFHLSNGLIISSRESHFHMVPLDEIVAIDFVFKYSTYRLDKNTLPNTFKEFVHFRSKGNELVLNEKYNLVESREINTWTLGWTDWVNEYLDEYDIKTGQHKQRYTLPRDHTKNPSHFHPQANKIGAE